MISAFQGMREAPIFERGNPLTPGMYDLEITRCIFKKTLQKGDAFIAEFKVLTTTDEKAHPVGSKRSYYQGMKNLTVAFPALKVFMAAAQGVNISDKAAVAAMSETIVEDMEAACGDANALAGAKLRDTVTLIRTQDKPGNPAHDFSQHNFEPLAG